MSTKKILNVGDIITETYGGIPRAVKRVTRVTEKYAFIRVNENHEVKLLRQAYSDGTLKEIGAIRYRITKQGDVEGIRLRNVRQSVKTTDWRNVSDEKIRQIYDILNNQ